MDGSTASLSWLMTAMGQIRLSGAMMGSSVKPPKADIWRPAGNVAEVPNADHSVVRQALVSSAATRPTLTDRHYCEKVVSIHARCTDTAMKASERHT